MFYVHLHVQVPLLEAGAGAGAGGHLGSEAVDRGGVTGGAGYGAPFVQTHFCEFRICQGIFSSAALCCVKGYIILNTFPFSSS